VANIYFHAI
jgi:hypothetical protein